MTFQQRFMAEAMKSESSPGRGQPARKRTPEEIAASKAQWARVRENYRRLRERNRAEG